METQETQEIKVKATSNVPKLRTRFIDCVLNNKPVLITSVGVDALGQKVKALASMRSILKTKFGIDAVWYSDWTNTSGLRDGKKLSMITTKIIKLSEDKNVGAE